MEADVSSCNEKTLSSSTKSYVYLQLTADVKFINLGLATMRRRRPSEVFSVCELLEVTLSRLLSECSPVTM